MNQLILPDNHWIHTSAKDITEICQPLFEKFSLAAYIYAKIYYDNTAIYFSSDIRYPNFHLSCAFPLRPDLPPILWSKSKAYYLASLSEDKAYQQFLQKCREHLQIDQPFYMAELHPDYIELFTFAAVPNQPNIINTYFNNLDELESFKTYFRDKARVLFKQAEKQKFILPELSQTTADIKNTVVRPQTLQQFSKTLFQKHYHLVHRSYHITKREMECLYLLGKGYTHKEIGRELSLSPRTVEYYLKNAKEKLKCYSKRQMLDLISQIMQVE